MALVFGSRVANSERGELATNRSDLRGSVLGMPDALFIAQIAIDTRCIGVMDDCQGHHQQRLSKVFLYMSCGPGIEIPVVTHVPDCEDRSECLGFLAWSSQAFSHL